MQQTTQTLPQGMIVICKGIDVILKIWANAEKKKAEELATYLKKLGKLPPMELIYAHAISMEVGTEQNLIVMTMDEKRDPQQVYKGPDEVDAMCAHTFHKPGVNPLVIGGIADDSYTIIEHLEQT